MKRALALLLALLCCAACFVSCKQEEEKGEDLLIVSDSCNIVYDTDTAEKSDAEALASAIEKKTGIKPKVSSSRSFIGGIRAPEGTIILGCLDHDAAKEAISGIRTKDYVCGVYGGRYVIGGLSADMTKKAITYFTNTVLEGVAEDNTLTVNTLNNYYYAGEYKLNALTVGGVSIGEFSICIPHTPSGSEERTALILQRLLGTRTGFVLPIKKGVGEGERQIRIGTGLCVTAKVEEEHGYAVQVKGAVIEIAAESFYGYLELQRVLGSRIFYSKTDTLEMNDGTRYNGDGKDEVLGTLQSSGDVRMLFHNIWGSTDDNYAQRAAMMVEIYAEYLPDIIGLQEFSPQLRALLVPALKRLGYAEVPTPAGSVFYGSESATRTPVFYRTEAVELLESGHTCLAVMDFGKYPELLGGYSAVDVKNVAKSDRSKGFTWGIFRTKQSGKVFLAASTHLWWMDGAVHDIARVVQMQEMRNLLTAEAAEFMTAKGLSGTMPIYIGGDFNTRAIRDSYYSMSRRTPFDAIHTYLPRSEQPAECTTHEYPAYNAETGLWEKAGAPWADYSYALDYIFANQGACGTYTVVRMEMISEDYAFATSDHSPIFADISFGAAVPTLTAQ